MIRYLQCGFASLDDGKQGIHGIHIARRSLVHRRVEVQRVHQDDAYTPSDTRRHLEHVITAWRPPMQTPTATSHPCVPSSSVATQGSSAGDALDRKYSATSVQVEPTPRPAAASKDTFRAAPDTFCTCTEPNKRMEGRVHGRVTTRHAAFPRFPSARCYIARSSSGRIFRPTRQHSRCNAPHDGLCLCGGPQSRTQRVQGVPNASR